MRNICLLALLLLIAAVPSRAAAQTDEEALTGSTSEPAAAPAAEPASDEEEATLSVQTVPRVPSEAAIEAIEDAVERLVQLEVGLAAESSPRVAAARTELAVIRARLRDALLAVGALRAEQDLRDWLLEQGVVTIPTASSEDDVAGEEDTGRMSAEDLSALTAAIDAAPFNEGKLQALREGLEGRVLDSDQALGLLELFSFSRDRVDALVFLHPRLSDGKNFDKLLDALKFESDRKAVRDRLGLDG